MMMMMMMMMMRVSLTSSMTISFTVVMMMMMMLSCLLPAKSQYFEFSNLPLPQANQVLVLHRFFPYVNSDPPPLSYHSIPIGLSHKLQHLTFPLFKTSLNAKSIQVIGTLKQARERTALHLDEGSDQNFNLHRYFPPPPPPPQHQRQSNRFLQNEEEAADVHDTAETARGAAGPNEDTPHRNVTGPTAIYPALSRPTRHKLPLTAAVVSNVRFLNPLATEIVFDDIRIGNDVMGGKPLVDSIQLSIVDLWDFWDLFLTVNSTDGIIKFCCDEESVSLGLCKYSNQLKVPEHIKTFKSVVVGQHSQLIGSNVFGFQIDQSNLYVLILSNCGIFDIPNRTIFGKVYLHNYFGYLPGTEAPKISIYVALSLFYLFLLLFWSMICLRHRTQLIQIHVAMTFVFLICLIESAVWYIYYRHRNLQPKPSLFIFGLCIVVSVVKNIFAFMLVLVASLGWGITKPQLERSTKQKIYLIIISYIIFDSARQIMTQFRLSHELPFLLVLSCIIPVSLLHGIIFFWIFTSLSEIIENLTVTRQEQKLALFSKFWVVLLVTLITAIIFLIAEVLSMSHDALAKWKQEWIFSEAAPHLFFIMILIAMLSLWAPNRSSKSMAYSSEVPFDDPNIPAGKDLQSNVLGKAVETRHSDDRDTVGSASPESSDFNRIEMSKTDGTVFNVWNKQQNLMKELDSEDES